MAVSHPSPKMAGAATTVLSVDAQNQLVAQYCVTCHSEKGKAGGLTLAGFDMASVEQHADVAEKMIRKLRAGMMPPPNAKRPDPAVIKSFVDALETMIDAAAALNPNPGWRPFQRLCRKAGVYGERPAIHVFVRCTSFASTRWDAIGGIWATPSRREIVHAMELCAASPGAMRQKPPAS